MISSVALIKCDKQRSLWEPLGLKGELILIFHPLLCDGIRPSVVGQSAARSSVNSGFSLSKMA